MIFSKETTRVVSIPKLEKFIAAFGRYRLKSPFFSQKGFFGYKNPPGGQPLGGSQKFFRVKTTSKMNSTPSNYSECKFSAKSDNF